MRVEAAQIRRGGGRGWETRAAVKGRVEKGASLYYLTNLGGGVDD
jgi:hypothetical protein